MAEMGVTINGIHSSEFGIHLKKLKINYPNVKSNIIEIPGSSKIIDLTESLTGHPEYSQRKLTITFGVSSNWYDWNRILEKISLNFHGRQCKIIFDNDKDYYYIARLSLNATKTKRVTGEIVLEGNAEPFKYSIYSTADQWEWDPFDFENDIISTIDHIDIDGDLFVSIYDTGVPACPEIIVHESNAHDLYLTYEDIVYDLTESGRYRFPTIRIGQDSEPLHFTGHGIISIDYRKILL